MPIYMPGIFPDAGDTAVNQTGKKRQKNSSPQGAYVFVEHINELLILWTYRNKKLYTHKIIFKRGNNETIGGILSF